MDHRLSYRRREWLLAVLCAALGSLLAAGCQSNAQHDLVSRELRMQEDQLYAMENYLEQYQQLVCKYRSENAALRRRLSDDYYDSGEQPEPRLTPPSRVDEEPTPGSPIEAPGSPGPGSERPEATDIEVPVVPPLEGSTQDESDGFDVITASHEELANGEGPTAEAAGQAAGELSELFEMEPDIASSDEDKLLEPIASELADAEPASPVWLHGEVVENDGGGGPRLSVNIDHFDELGNHTMFDGNLSLMLMATSNDGGQQSLARWDYNTQDVSLAVVDAAFEPTMRFHLELPADTPLDESTELWVRLVPAEGTKLLAHTPIDLQQPGSFSSRTKLPTPDRRKADASIMASEELADPVDDEVETPSIGSRIAVNIVGSDWTTARPNEPANLPAELDSGAGWRASSEIIPTTVQSKPVPPHKLFNDVQPAVHTEIATTATSPPAYKPPTWSPDRGERADRNGRKIAPAVARRPAWSATR